MILENKKISSNIQLYHYSLVDPQEICEQYIKWLNDTEIAKLIALPNQQIKDKNFILESFQRFTQKNCIGFFIKDLTHNLFIGTCKIDKIDLINKSCEIGIMIGEKQFYGKGISKIVFAIILDYVFNILKFHRIWGGCLSINIPMNKTFKSLGFRNEGIIKDAILINDKYFDNCLYAMLIDEYNPLKNNL